MSSDKQFQSFLGQPQEIDRSKGGVVLSLFPGIDLLGRGFEAEGFHVVRGPDPIFGQSIEGWHPPRDTFDGIIGGPPCQDFSQARRVAPDGHGIKMVSEFIRCVDEAMPDWFLMENVTRVPSVTAQGCRMQRFNLRASEFGLRQQRNRCFQFGSRDGAPLSIWRHDLMTGPLEAAAMASEGKRSLRRSWADFCELQGLPRDFELPGWSIAAKYRAVGNGVPIPMARAVAIAILTRGDTGRRQLCVCECGRIVLGKGRHATAACRKRMERSRRVSAGVTLPGPVTAELSPCRIDGDYHQLGHVDLFRDAAAD